MTDPDQYKTVFLALSTYEARRDVHMAMQRTEKAREAYQLLITSPDLVSAEDDD